MNLRILFCILLVIPLGQLGIDIYLPSLPAMQAHMHSTEQLIQLSLSLYILFAGLAQLVYGVLSDYFGRRKCLFIGLSIYIIASIGCAFANNIFYLLAFRILQGVGIGGGTVITNGIIGDAFSGKALAKAASYSTTVYASIPIIAPVIGGYIQEFFGWQYNFWLLAIATIAVFLVCIFLLPETLKQKVTTKPLKNLTTIALNQTFWRYVFGMALAFSIIIVFNTICPILLQTVFNLTPSQYGQTALFIGVAYLIGTFSNTKLLSYLSFSTLLKVGILMMFIGSAILLIIADLPYYNTYLFIAPIVLCTIGSGFIFPNLMGQCIGLYKKNAGTVSALMGAAVLLGCAVISWLVTYLPAKSVFSLPTVFIVLSLFSFINFFSMKER